MGTVCLFSPLGAAGEPAAGGPAPEGEAEARREEGRRLAELAHEINNPLGILLNYLKLIRSGGSLEQVHADAEVMSGEIRRIKRILGRFQQGGRGRGAAAPGTAGVRAVIDGVIALLRLKLQQLEGENPVTVEIETEEEPRLAVEADLLRQVVLNVAMNGIEAMPDGGPLSIRVRPAGGGRLAIEVRDEGVGIPAEDLERIFEPFFTTKELRAPPGREGTRGLGLPLSRDIVCRHGGTIEVESVPGEGSTFRILLPLPLPG